MPIVQCPRCRAELDVDDADLGHKVECPQCQAVFPAVLDDDRSWRRNDLDDREDEYRRRDELDPRNRTRDLERAEAVISKPANGLIWTSAITIVLGLILAGILGVVGYDKVENGRGMDRDKGVEFIVYAVFAGIVSPIWHLVMLVCAQKAKKLEGTGTAITAGILGIVTFVTCGPCTILSIFAMSYGIWLIVAVSKPEVKRALRWSKEGYAPRFDEPTGGNDAFR
jgi:predicted Zn finger-like uncharacterized protein